jgi:tRNA(Ile)-lysidine synthase
VATADHPVGDVEASALFAGLEGLPGLVLAVSGGSDSTALLVMVARWAKRLKRAPKLLTVTIDHGLRPEAQQEAAAVQRLARSLGIRHRTVRWRGKKPASGLQEAARIARYRLLAETALDAGFEHILTAHTLDDQAETVLFRLARGSGLTGLSGMAYASAVPISEGRASLFLIRPLLPIAKARLLATLRKAGVAHSEDPSNVDPRFTRTRLRALMPHLVSEGLDARSLVRLAARVRRAEATIEFAVTAAHSALAPGPWVERGPIAFDAARFGVLPAEVALRLLGRAINHAGDEGPVELAKLEALYDALRLSPGPIRRTLAGALVTFGRGRLVVERAPPRRASLQRRKAGGNRRFTK